MREQDKDKIEQAMAIVAGVQFLLIGDGIQEEMEATPEMIHDMLSGVTSLLSGLVVE